MIEVALLFVQVSLTTFIFSHIRRRVFKREPAMLSAVKEWMDDQLKNKLHKSLSSEDPYVTKKLEELAELVKKRNRLSEEAERNLNTSNFSHHSKLKRDIIVLDEKISAETQILKGKLEETYPTHRSGTFTVILKGVFKFLFHLLNIVNILLQ